MVVDIGTIFLQWENMGVFEFILPFLLVFAVVFGIMSATNMLGSNRGIHIIIALIIGLMAVGYSFTLGFSLGEFLADLFPRLGIGLAILLTIMITAGLFIADDMKKFWAWGLSALGAVIGIIIIAQVFSNYGWYSVSSLGDMAGWILLAVIGIGIIIAVGAASNKNSETSKENSKFGHWYPANN